MGRKKKKEPIKTSAIGYSGNVTVKVLHKDKVVKTYKQHNAGSVKLFKFIATCLGNTYEDSGAPRFIRLFASDHTQLVDALPYSQILVESDNSDPTKPTASVSFTFVVPGSIFDTGSSNPKYLRLYSSEGLGPVEWSSDDKWLAELEFDNEVEINSSSNIIIIWELIVGNAPIE